MANPMERSEPYAKSYKADEYSAPTSSIFIPKGQDLSSEGKDSCGKVIKLALFILVLAAAAACLGCGVAFGITPCIIVGAIALAAVIGPTLLGCCCRRKEVKYEHVS